MTLLADIVDASTAVAATSSRSAKTARIAELLRHVEPGEAAIAVAYLSGQLRQRQIGVGYASLRDLPAHASDSILTLLEVDSALEQVGLVAGRDSQSERRRLLNDLFMRATSDEQRFLMRLII